MDKKYIIIALVVIVLVILAFAMSQKKADRRDKFANKENLKPPGPKTTPPEPPAEKALEEVSESEEATEEETEEESGEETTEETNELLLDLSDLTFENPGNEDVIDGGAVVDTAPPE